MYNDKTLTCADCSQQFVFTASEQDFYAQRGFTEPRRCAELSREPQGGPWDDGRRRLQLGRGLRRWRRLQLGRRLRPRSARDVRATCSNCGSEAQVPFRPTSGKPVYCSDCFRSMRGN